MYGMLCIMFCAHYTLSYRFCYLLTHFSVFFCLVNRNFHGPYNNQQVFGSVDMKLKTNNIMEHEVRMRGCARNQNKTVEN
jgi:hypothetical protein